MKAAIAFFNTSGGMVGGLVSSTVFAADGQITALTAVAPAGAAWVKPYFYCVDPVSAGSSVTMDRLGLWAGAGGDWAMPGEPILNQGRRVTRPNGTDRLVEVWDGTAWVVVHYDSGWRDISGLLINGWTSSGLRALLRNGVVHISGTLNGATATDKIALVLPAGWRPALAMQRPVSVAASISQGIALEIGTNGTFYLWNGNGKTGSQYVQSTFPVPLSTIPTTLPGTLIAAAP